MDCHTEDTKNKKGGKYYHTLNYCVSSTCTTRGSGTSKHGLVHAKQLFKVTQSNYQLGLQGKEELFVFLVQKAGTSCL
jgi:hypothetical protein